MVLVAACIFSQHGKVLLARQFVHDMTRTRLECLLDSFPKLLQTEKNSTNREHTFIENESVRYVYQPMERIYMVLVTTKASNILEDLETLRLFARVIPEHCKENEEKEVFKHVFDLIFAFDEIVSLGYRENVNINQIRTFTEMESHEENVYLRIKEAQEKAAKQIAKERAKELKRLHVNGLKHSSVQMSNDAVSSACSVAPTVIQDAEQRLGSKPVVPRRGLILSSKKKTEKQFMEQLQKEGETMSTESANAEKRSILASNTNSKREAVHIKADEKFNALIGRAGGVQLAEISGSMTIAITDATLSTVKIYVKNSTPEDTQFQVHPHLDKNEFLESGMLALKNASKPFPIDTDIGVLKWRRNLQSEEQIPLILNCWPQESSTNCQVNIEYTLQRTGLNLNNVTITVPLPASTVPVIAECEGSYEFVKARSHLIWTIPLINDNSKTGSLEFSVGRGHAKAFFPVTVSFISQELYHNIKVESVFKSEDTAAIPYSSDTLFVTENYQIV